VLAAELEGTMGEAACTLADITQGTGIAVFPYSRGGGDRCKQSCQRRCEDFL